MRRMKGFFVLFGIFVAGCVVATSAFACKVYLDFSASVPMNDVDIGNEARLRLADTVIRARSWPDETIASISTPAFATEQKPHELAIRRAMAMKEYLIQLGVKEKNIFYDANVLSKLVAPNKAARDRLRDVYIEFTPQCGGHCAQLCGGTYSPPGH